MVTCPAILDVPPELVTFLARLPGDERRARGARTGARALSCGKQALFGLVWFRERRDVALIGEGLGISRATFYRYLDEVIDVLAAQNPRPAQHAATTRAGHRPYSTTKGVDTDRLGIKTTSRNGATIDAWYSGRTHDFGGNIQALTRPDGLPIRISEVEPGSTHDLTAARTHVLGALRKPEAVHSLASGRPPRSMSCHRLRMPSF